MCPPTTQTLFMTSQRLAIVTVLVLAALNAYVDLLHVRQTHKVAVARPPPLSHYSKNRLTLPDHRCLT